MEVRNTLFVAYRCQTCGKTYQMSADAWRWHRWVEHPAMGYQTFGKEANRLDAAEIAYRKAAV